jgi:hypothetical protein
MSFEINDDGEHEYSLFIKTALLWILSLGHWASADEHAIMAHPADTNS